MGVKLHDPEVDPEVDQVLRPVESDSAISVNLCVSPTVSEVTFHVTVGIAAADTGALIKPIDNNSPPKTTAIAIIRLMRNTLHTKYGSLFIMNLTGARITQQGDLTYSTPFPRVVSACRHYWCPFGVHSDASGLLRRALVRRVVPSIPSVASLCSSCSSL